MVTVVNTYGQVYLTFKELVLMQPGHHEVDTGTPDVIQLAIRAVLESNRTCLGWWNRKYLTITTGVKAEVCPVRQMVQTFKTRQLKLDRKTTVSTMHV